MGEKKKTEDVGQATATVDDDLGELDSAFSWRTRFRKRRLSEAVFEIDNPDAGTEFDDRFFRNIERASALDLPPHIQRKSQRLSILLWRKNVRAYGATEIIKDFVLGDGISFESADPKVQEVLEEYWEVNEWEDKLEERLRTLSVFGEQLYPTFVNTTTGLVRNTSITPLRIRGINRDANDAEELVSVSTSVGAERPASVIYLPGFIGDPDAGKVFQIIRPSDDGTLLFEPRLNNAFFFAINRLSGGTRGAPDMLSSVDWLEGIDGFVFSMMERAAITQDVVWDITFDGLTETEIRQKTTGFINALRAGGVFGHNEKVKLAIQVPDLGSGEAQTATNILQSQINAGMRLPGLFFGQSSDLTRAAASELSIPVAKMIQGRQKFFRRMLAKMFRFQIEQAIKVGRLEGVKDFSFEIEMPQVFLRDVKVLAQAMVALSTALGVAVERGWIAEDEASRIFRMAIREFGGLGRTQSKDTKEEEDPDAEEPVGDFENALNAVGQDDHNSDHGSASKDPGAGV